MKKILKLGTRRSLLAWAQSSWVAREVERLNPEVQVELVGIETRGDRILDVPLREVNGKEFFVAEIDEALHSGSVDFTVHSMKDLSLERPPQFVCGAIPKRENPRDVILFSPRVLERLRSGESIRIGTSSPRRLENIPKFLEQALPQVAPQGRPSIQFVEIRGNVNTRLSRVHEPLDSPKYLDGVVLAFAGLIRLWADEAGQKELKKLLSGVRWMILPLKECPAAPAQGALAVECRAQDSEIREILGKLHHLETAQRVALERQLLADWGGGCHQRFGATAIDAQELGGVLFIRGVKSNGDAVQEIRRLNLPFREDQGARSAQLWDGSENQPSSVEKREEIPPLGGRSVFVAHSRALAGQAAQLENSRVWTSGTSSWFKLANRGVWVEGCAEGLGFAALLDTLKEGVLTLDALRDWVVLTHAGATEQWGAYSMTVIPAYKINLDYGKEVRSSLQKATHVFWSSGTQFDELKNHIPPGVQHSCGPGKTADRLRKAGIVPQVFLSAEEWRKWFKKND